MNRHTILPILITLIVLCTSFLTGQILQADTGGSEVEVCFCLDTTGSMAGLIEGAKQKIWKIANQIIMGDPKPHLRIGLVGYRDYGDDYVTKIYPLNDDLDTVFENLMSFSADGGGDTPEHVNRALYDGVHRISWSTDDESLRLIFLVGDCPPHMDYKDGYDYHDACSAAVKRDIIINTIQCGDYSETVPVWKDIARRGEGKYAMIPQSGGMEVVSTPYDEELVMLNRELENTVVAFGSVSEKAKSESRKRMVDEMAPEVACERAAYKSKEGTLSSYDLIDALKDRAIELEGVRNAQLPEEMRDMSMKEKRAFLAQKEQERTEVMKQIANLSEKRSDYIAKKLKSEPDHDSFDETVKRIIERQASEKGISY